MKPIAQRMNAFSTQFFAQLSEKMAVLRAAGADVINLDIGSPDMPPAAHILEALNRAAASPTAHGYQPHSGGLALRQAWSAMYQRLYGVVLDPGTQVVPLLGSKEGIFHLSQALLEEGDIALVPDPGYITYTSGARFAGAEVYYMPLLARNAYLPDLASIPAEILNRAKILWLNYPGNPTAAVATPQFFAQVVDFSRQHNLLVCHDAAYAQVTFDGYQAPSILQAPGAAEVAVEFNTLSKSHNMAGWRVGVALGQVEALRALYRLKTNADSGHFLGVEAAATAAMTGDQGWLVERNAVYEQRRDALLVGLAEMGFAPETPRASLYIWCPVPQGWTSVDFATELLSRCAVSVTPGTVFGEQGEGFVRIALTASLERTQEALQRIAIDRFWLQGKVK